MWLYMRSESLIGLLARLIIKVYGPSNFFVDVSDDGGRGQFTVEWKETSVVITFRGSEQKDAVYELPFG